MSQRFVPQPNNNQPPLQRQGWVPPVPKNQPLPPNRPPHQMNGHQPYYSSLPPQNMQPPRVNHRPAPQRRPSPKKSRRPFNPVKYALIIALAILLIVGAFWGVNALRDNQVRQLIEPYQTVYAPNIFVNDVAIAGMIPQDAFKLIRDKMEERINSWNLAITYHGFTFTNLNYGVLGITVSDQEIQQLLNEAWLHTRKGTIHEQKAAIEALADTPLKLYTSQKNCKARSWYISFPRSRPMSTRTRWTQRLLNSGRMKRRLLHLLMSAQARF